MTLSSESIHERAMKMMETETGADATPSRTGIVPLSLAEPCGIRRINEPIRFGVPCPKGLLRQASEVTLWDSSGNEHPLQCQVLASWSDHSVKWLLVDCFVSLEPWGKREFQLKLNGGVSRVYPELPVTTVRMGESLYVKTGQAEFRLSGGTVKPFDVVTVADRAVAGGEESRLRLVDEEGVDLASHIDDMTVECAGALRLTVRTTGRFLRRESTFAEFVMRSTYYSSKSLAVLEFTLRNSRAACHEGGLWDLGDEGSIFFRDCSLQIAPMSGTIEEVYWTSDPAQALKKERPQSFVLYQDSSGGANWQSSNHVNRQNKLTTSFQGFRVHADEAIIAEGFRATPIISADSHDGRISAAMERFWQNFPKAMEVDSHKLTVRLFPHQQGDVFELQGGEQKTHTVVLQFEGNQTTESLAWVYNRLVPCISRSWYAGSQAIAHIADQEAVSGRSAVESQAERLVDTAVMGNNTFFDRRETIDEYGWRNFGDIYADHESAGATNNQPVVAHYNNQYDVIYGAIIQYIRSGNERWRELFSDLAQHVCDIDIYHTQEDRPAVNGGLFWHTDHYTDAGTATHRTYTKTSRQARESLSYGGGPACEHNYTSGLMHCYFLTGNPAMKEAVLQLADWVMRMDDGRTRWFGWLDRRPTGYCSVTATPGYHGPGRGAGNSINALMDGALLNDDDRYLEKAEELIRRCIHPHDDIAARNLADIEYRWSYTVFLQVLGKYLDVKIERGELDYMYAYARASLLHYATWMVSHEVPYKQVLHRVLIPTETWPAQDIRKANVFCVAAKHAADVDRQTYLKKAEEFFQACIHDLFSFKTHMLTRPIVLLMTNAYAVQYGLQHQDAVTPKLTGTWAFGTPKSFKPQFHELYVLRSVLSTVISKGRAVLRASSAPTKLSEEKDA